MADAFVVPWVRRDYSAAIVLGPQRNGITLDRGGPGYLAGDFPGGVTSVEGVPVAATVRVLLRDPGKPSDSTVVAEVQSGPDGTWRVDGLDIARKFDVIGRKDGFNDVIMADVTPVVG